MKKIKLSFKNTKEVLSRDQLKSIVGGFASGGSGDQCFVNCKDKDENNIASIDVGSECPPSSVGYCPPETYSVTCSCT